MKAPSPARRKELAKAARVLRRMGFVPVVWSSPRDDHQIWVDETYARGRRFVVTGSTADLDEIRTDASGIRSAVATIRKRLTRRGGLAAGGES